MLVRVTAILRSLVRIVYRNRKKIGLASPENRTKKVKLKALIKDTSAGAGKAKK